MFVAGLIEGGVRVVAAQYLPEIAAFFRVKHAQGKSRQEAHEELNEILFAEDTSEEQKIALIRAEAAEELAEMNAVSVDVESRRTDTE